MTNKCYFPGVPPKATWWQRQKKALKRWWLHQRVRLALWILRIDCFNIKMKGTIKNWETNIPEFYLTLDGNIDLMEEDAKFTHMNGTVTMTACSVGPIYDADGKELTESDGTTYIGLEEVE